ncbi:hypothetical protein [Synoicihabitans lomoniglobus]|uniref:Uncharacterized protein n=1 Tax=Synoicihabitans lomoniglobus TaxID=2909285 RepID=A0AAE9ZUP0_9BACT|nr:hypothetical protein [Opitutaceae bacterium LMO-M01]WED63359.1 hypothetical protein PXH66_13555 [Opitutaceae bacterium LMO-M01]
MIEGKWEGHTENSSSLNIFIEFEKDKKYQWSMGSDPHSLEEGGFRIRNSEIHLYPGDGSNPATYTTLKISKIEDETLELMIPETGMLQEAEAETYIFAKLRKEKAIGKGKYLPNKLLKTDPARMTLFEHNLPIPITTHKNNSNVLRAFCQIIPKAISSDLKNYTTYKDISSDNFEITFSSGVFKISVTILDQAKYNDFHYIYDLKNRINLISQRIFSHSSEYEINILPDRGLGAFGAISSFELATQFLDDDKNVNKTGIIYAVINTLENSPNIELVDSDIDWEKINILIASKWTQIPVSPNTFVAKSRLEIRLIFDSPPDSISGIKGVQISASQIVKIRRRASRRWEEIESLKFLKLTTAPGSQINTTDSESVLDNILTILISR